jgi:tetratricopeptide (TPR) repeat protein
MCSHYRIGIAFANDNQFSPAVEHLSTAIDVMERLQSMYTFQSQIFGALRDLAGDTPLSGQVTDCPFIRPSALVTSSTTYEATINAEGKARELPSHSLLPSYLAAKAIASSADQKKRRPSTVEINTETDLAAIRANVSMILSSEAGKLNSDDSFLPSVGGDESLLRHFAHLRVAAFHERAKALQMLGRHSDAIYDFTITLAFCPSSANAYFRRAFSYKATGRFDAAGDDFETARKKAGIDNPVEYINYVGVNNVSVVVITAAGEEPVLPLMGMQSDNFEDIRRAAGDTIISSLAGVPVGTDVDGP